MTTVWDCPLCGQAVEILENGRARQPQTVYENCRLKEHYVGDVCLAYHDLERARKILAGEK
jgi:hypothetical protein